MLKPRSGKGIDLTYTVIPVELAIESATSSEVLLVGLGSRILSFEVRIGFRFFGSCIYRFIRGSRYVLLNYCF